MEFQNLKLEKERERETEESKKQKRQSIEKRESTFGMVGYERRWQWATIAWETTFVIVGYEFALWMSEWVWEGGVKGCSSKWVFELWGFCNEPFESAMDLFLFCRFRVL